MSTDRSRSLSLHSFNSLPDRNPSKADLTDMIDEHPVFESSSMRRELMVIIGSLIRFIILVL